MTFATFLPVEKHHFDSPYDLVYPNKHCFEQQRAAAVSPRRDRHRQTGRVIFMQLNSVNSAELVVPPLAAGTSSSSVL